MKCVIYTILKCGYNKSEVWGNNTISPDHTPGNCCDEVIVYSVTDIACENRERIIEFEAIMDADSVCICLLYTSRCV